MSDEKKGYSKEDLNAISNHMKNKNTTKNVHGNNLSIVHNTGNVINSQKPKSTFEIKVPEDGHIMRPQDYIGIREQLPVIAEIEIVNVSGAELIKEIREINQTNKEASKKSGLPYKRVKFLWTDGTKLRPRKSYPRQDLVKVDIVKRLKAAYEKNGIPGIREEVINLCFVHQNTIDEMKKYYKVKELNNPSDLQNLSSN